jgi:dipeptidase D
MAASGAVLLAAACGDSSSQVDTCDEGCVVDVFKDLSKVYRPSYGEAAARDWVQKQVTEAMDRGVWKTGELVVDMDEYVDPANHTLKNILVRVPATGPFANKNLKPIAMQGHLDIVFAVDGAPSGQPLDDYYRNGVDLVDDSGVLHSRNFKTTLGADCGTGIAQMVRYLFDRSLPHPPLELMFTSAEEVGVVSALHWDVAKLPLHAGALINLDGWSATSVVKDDLNAPLAIQRGAAGAIAEAVDGKLDASAAPADANLIKISLSGLLGGHSGFLIARPRMNAIVAFAALTQEAFKLDPNLRLVSINSGQVSARVGQNKIASAFDAVFAASSTTTAAALDTALQTFFASYRAPFTDESATDVKLVVSATTGTAQTALSTAATHAMVDTLHALPNGVVVADPGSLGGWKVSSNMGVLGVNDATTGKAVFFGYMPRAFVIGDAQNVGSQVFTSFQQTGIASPTQASAVVPAWLVDSTAAVVTVAEAGSGVNRDMVLPAGTEPGALLDKFPNLKDRVIGIAPAVIGAHTPKEAVGVQSFRDSTTALQKILVAFGNDGSLLR